MAIILYGLIGLFLGLITHRLVNAIREGAVLLPSLYNDHIHPVLSRCTQYFKDMLRNIDPEILAVLENMSRNIADAFGKLVSFLSKGLVNFVSGAASGVPTTILSIIVMILSTFFLVMDAERIQEFARTNLPAKYKAGCYKIRDYLTGTLAVVVKSYLLIMLVTFLELTLLFWIFGISNPAVKASLIAVLDILPLLGTGTILIPWAIISMIAGSVARGVKLLVIYGIVTLVRNYIEPRIVGPQLGLHPIITLVAMFLGLRLFGFLGMFGLPLSISFFWKEYKEKAAAKASSPESSQPA